MGKGFTHVTPDMPQWDAVKAGITRKCGGCTACCYTFKNDELDKPVHRWCVHARDGGCAIYSARPSECANFYCGWLANPWVPDSFRPDRIGCVFDVLVDPDRFCHPSVVDGQEWIRVTQLSEGRWLEPKPQELIRGLLSNGCCVGVVHAQRVVMPDITIIVPGQEPVRLLAVWMIPGLGVYKTPDVVAREREGYEKMTMEERGYAIAEIAIVQLCDPATRASLKALLAADGDTQTAIHELLTEENAPQVNALMRSWFERFPELQEWAHLVEFV